MVDIEVDLSQGLEDIPLCDENEDDTSEEDMEDDASVMGGCNFEAETAVNSVEDLDKINLSHVFVEDVMRFHFLDLSIAFAFYNWYASVNGFAARKSKVMRNRKGEITQQTFLCYKEGQREAKDSNTDIKRREPKRHTRCGCEARCMVHIEETSGRWYIKYFNDIHNHTLMDDHYTGMLPAHRKMSEFDKFQMNTMRRVGIRTSHIYGLFACQSGGFDKVRFLKRDMYNQQSRQRRSEFSDAKVALDFLEGMCSKDEMMFWKHTVDKDGRLEHLFWCDGVSRRDFAVFGDVLAFDATYRKNKYLCPLVVFSGVNHHIQSIVFGGAIVANEKEETYVWLLEQFLEAMGGKAPGSVITDGDVAMKNAIRRVFPNAHHRLCAWHLIHNASTNVKNPQFVSKFKQCMLGDYDIDEFHEKWDKMVAEFHLEENDWVSDLFEKRRMWATAYIRGSFFAGFRTTSRCEGLHSEFGKYVNLHNSLMEFLQHFFRWLSYMRFREVEADFNSIHGEPVLQTQFKCIEKSAADVYTKEVFLLFRPVLERSCRCHLLGFTKTAETFIYTVGLYRKEYVEWRVSFCQETLQFKCSCQRFESLGIPCEHLVFVMLNLNIVQLPDCVVLNRWTKAAKDSVASINDPASSSQEPSLIGQYFCVVERCKRMETVALECGKPEWMRKTVELVTAHTELLEAVRKGLDIDPTLVDPHCRSRLLQFD